MYGGGIGYRCIPGRALLGVGVLTTAIASGDVGAVMAKQQVEHFRFRTFSVRTQIRSHTFGSNDWFDSVLSSVYYVCYELDAHTSDLGRSVYEPKYDLSRLAAMIISI